MPAANSGAIIQAAPPPDAAHPPELLALPDAGARTVNSNCRAAVSFVLSMARTVNVTVPVPVGVP